jgi:hypothetical protein
MALEDYKMMKVHVVASFLANEGSVTCCFSPTANRFSSYTCFRSNS